MNQRQKTQKDKYFLLQKNLTFHFRAENTLNLRYFHYLWMTVGKAGRLQRRKTRRLHQSSRHRHLYNFHVFFNSFNESQVPPSAHTIHFNFISPKILTENSRTSSGAKSGLMKLGPPTFPRLHFYLHAWMTSSTHTEPLNVTWCTKVWTGYRVEVQWINNQYLFSFSFDANAYTINTFLLIYLSPGILLDHLIWSDNERNRRRFVVLSLVTFSIMG